MTPAEFLDQCAARGIAFEVVVDKLRAWGPRQPASVAACLRHHKWQLIALLKERSCSGQIEPPDQPASSPSTPSAEAEEALLAAAGGANLVALVAHATAGRLPSFDTPLTFPCYIAAPGVLYHVRDLNVHVLGCLRRWRCAQAPLATPSEASPELHEAWQRVSRGEVDNLMRIRDLIGVTD